MKRISTAALFAVLFGALLFPGAAAAGVDVNITIGVPPPVVFPAPPLLLPIPGAYAYFAPDVDVDIIFYQGYWYRPHRGHWYRSDRYDGRWVLLKPTLVPRVILKLPPNWKQAPPGHRKLPYGEVRSNWRQWERDRHWDRRDDRRDRKGDRRERYEKREDRRDRSRERHEERQNHGHGSGKGGGKGKHRSGD